MSKRYEPPQHLQTDWHIPLINIINAQNDDIEYRGPIEDMNSIVDEPNEGVKFYATDTGEIYIGDGTEMQGPVLPDHFTEHVEDSDLHGGSGVGTVEPNTAVSDGTETHDTIQAAIDAATDTVHIGPGSYTENVTIDKSDLTITGSGWDTIIDGGSDTDDDAVFIGSNADDVVLQSLTATVSGSARSAVRATENNTRLWLRDILITGGGADTGPTGMQIESGSEKYIERCRVTSWTAGRGIMVDDTVTGGWCVLTRASGVPNDSGIQIDGDGYQIALNRSRNADKGIVAQGEAQVIAHNVVEDTTDDAYRIRGTGQTLIGNRAWDYGGSAWSFTAATVGLTRMGNVWSATRGETDPENDGAPTTFVSETEPTEWREGDIWLEPE